MAWAVPRNGRPEVNAAGKLFASANIEDVELFIEALSKINNWRAAHAFPLNTFQVNLRRKSKAIDDDSLIVQRTKRLASIGNKLRRFPDMKLSQMQDIGGCRAILKDVSSARELVEQFQASAIKHKLASKDDYISIPKASGYRGIHLVYRYFSDKKLTYNGLKIELQIRTQMQHAWATAVEVVGTLVRQSLKSSQGEEDWLRFFTLMGSATALDEHCPTVPNTPADRVTLQAEIKKLAESLSPIDKLSRYSEAIQVVENLPKKSKYYLLDLRPSENKLNVTGFSEADSERASNVYLETENSLKQDEGDEAVLVSVDSIDALRKAYPNYFLDTRLFSLVVKRWCK